MSDHHSPHSAPAPTAHVTSAPTYQRKPVLRRETVERLMNIGSPLLLLLIWELAAQLRFIDVRFFPAPSKVFLQLFTLVQNGVLWMHTWASLQRLFWGFIWGGLPALVLGVAMGLYRNLRVIVEPIIAATYPIPKSAILPLILLIFGLGEASKVVMVATGVFFPILINSMAGVLEIQKIHFDVSANFGASRWQVFKTVALPGALPLIMTGVKLGVGLGLVLISIAEMVGAKSGLGYMIWNAWEILSVETMYVGLIVIAVLGLILSLLLTEIERIIVPWKSSH
jgi:NitT/TauT family transport system permease protein